MTIKSTVKFVVPMQKITKQLFVNEKKEVKTQT